MNCNCKKELESQLTARLQAQNSDGVGHDVSLQGYGFGMTRENSIVLIGCMPYTETHTATTKAGAKKVKNRKGTMVFSFCPFCGVSARAQPSAPGVSAEEKAAIYEGSALMGVDHLAGAN